MVNAGCSSYIFEYCMITCVCKMGKLHGAASARAWWRRRSGWTSWTAVVARRLRLDHAARGGKWGARCAARAADRSLLNLRSRARQPGGEVPADVSQVMKSSAGGTAGAVGAVGWVAPGAALNRRFRSTRCCWAHDRTPRGASPAGATDAVMLYGKARRGDRTLVDPLPAPATSPTRIVGVAWTWSSAGNLLRVSGEGAARDASRREPCRRWRSHRPAPRTWLKRTPARSASASEWGLWSTMSRRMICSYIRMIISRFIVSSNLSASPY